MSSNSWVSGGLFDARMAMRKDMLQTFLWVVAHRMSEVAFSVFTSKFG